MLERGVQFMHQDGTLKTPQSRADSWDIIQPRFQDTEFFVPLIPQCGSLTSHVLVMKHPWNSVLGISTSIRRLHIVQVLYVLKK